MIFTVAVITVHQVKPDLLSGIASIQFDITTIILSLIVLLAVFFPLLQRLFQEISKIQRRWFLVLLCIALLILKLILPNIQIDTNSIWLIVIVSVLFVLPELRSLTPYIKKIKIGDTEIELKEKIENLEKEVEKAQASVEETPSNSDSLEIAEQVSVETMQILQEASRNPQAALLLLSARIEEQLRRRIKESGIDTPKIYSIIRLVEVGVQNKVFPYEFLLAFKDFSAVRNRVAHGQAFDVDDSTVLSVISLGTDLLKIASTVTPRTSLYPREENGLSVSPDASHAEKD